MFMLWTATSAVDSVRPMRNNLKHSPRIVLFLALAFAVTSCSGWSGWLLSDTARNTFSEQQSCPEERIEMSYAVVQPQDVFQMPAPLAEVAADPGRLKVWTRKIDDDFRNYREFTLFDVVGCGAHYDYFYWSEI